MSTMGDVQHRGGYQDKCGGYLEYHRGAILSMVGDNQYHGGYLDASGGYHE